MDVVTWGARWALSDRGEVTLDGSYTLSDAGYDALELAPAADVPLALFPDGLPGPCDDPTAPLGVHDFDFSGVADYSDLEFTEFRATLGLRRDLGRGIGFYSSLSFYDLQDDELYVQDLNGSVVLLAGGLTFSY